MSGKPQVSIRTPAIDRRSMRITQLLPLASFLRATANTELRAFSAPLEMALRDLERLNEIELACVQADDNTGPSLWMRIVRILEA